MPPSPPARFYPPRAPWYRPGRDAADALRRFLGIRRFGRAARLTRTETALGLLIPGVGLALRRSPLLAPILTAVSLGLTLGFLACLGTPTENLFAAGLVGIHGAGVVQVVRPRLEFLGPALRTGFAAFVAMALALGLYLPALQVLHHWVALPLITPDGTVIIRPGLDPGLIRRGDWIAYHLIPERLPRGYIIPAGPNFAPVLAIPGDRIAFEPDQIRINEIPAERTRAMPKSGEWTLPPGTWFIWPGADLRRYAAADAEEVDAELVRIASVRQDRLIGRPYHRWFHRTQSLP